MLHRAASPYKRNAAGLCSEHQYRCDLAILQTSLSKIVNFVSMLEHVLQDHKLGLMYSFIGGSLILVIGIAHNLLTVWFSRRRLKRAHSCAPPAKLPHRDPVFGLDELWDTIQAAKAHTYFDRIRQQYRTYGSTFASQTLTYSIINTIEPRNLEAILSSNFKDYEIGFPRRHAFFHLLGNSLILSDGEQWEHSKALLRPSFARSQVSDLAALDVHVENLLAAIPRDGSTVDLGTLFFQLTADATIDLMFGESVHSVGREDDLQADFMRAFQDAQAGGERRFRLGKFVHFVSQRDYYQSIRRVHQFIDAHVEWALRHSDVTEENEKSLQRYIFARELAKMTQDRKVLRSELLTIFLAGRETTSALMTSLFFAIARRPETWRRLRAEVSQLNAAKASYKQLKDLRYLRCCINESKRQLVHQLDF